MYDRVEELFRGFVEAEYDTYFQPAAKKNAKYLDSSKYLERDEIIKKVSEYNKQEGKIHEIQSKQESKRQIT